MNRTMLIGVDVMFLAICVVAAILSLDFAEGARTFPLSVSLVAAPLAAANLWQDLRAQRRPEGDTQHDDSQRTEAANGEAAESEQLRNAAKWLGYIAAFALAVLLLGAAVAATIWLVFFLRRYGRVRYRNIVINVACVLVALYLLDRFLNITLPPGIFW